MDCIIKIEEPFQLNSSLIDPKRIFADKPIYSVYGVLDPRLTGMFWYCEDDEGEEPKLSLFEEPFYVGQSLNFENRKSQHQTEAINYYNNNPLKEERIRDILAEGLEPIFVVLKEGLYFEEANKWEKYYIKLIGRLDKGTGPLTNLSDGGAENSSGVIWGEARRKKMSLINSGKNNPRYGIPVKDITRKRLSISLKGKMLGFKHTDSAKEKNRNSHIFQNYIFFHKDGRIIETNNMIQFCKDNDLLKTVLSKMLYGKKKSHHGWTGYIIGKEYLREIFDNPPPNYIMISPENIKYEVRKLKPFCIKHKLHERSIHEVIHGNWSNYKGWIGWKIGQEHLRDKFKKENCNYILIGPNGNEYEVNSLKNFCEDNMLYYNSFLKLVNQKITDYKGWILKFKNETFKLRRKE